MVLREQSISGSNVCPVPIIEPRKTDTRLTAFAKGGGCGCKMDPTELGRLLAKFPKDQFSPNLLVGIETNDDAAVYKLSDREALVFTNDFHTPTVDDPYVFGRAAAANALSDIYAMGGKPFMANAIVGFPVDEVTTEVLQETMRGGVEVCQEVDIPLSGGHSIVNPQPIFGLAAIGRIHPGHIKTNSGAKPGDELILTKPLGVGILASAFRIDMLDDTGYQEFVKIISSINKQGAWLGELGEVHAMTDVTGFGLVGHLTEMAIGAQANIKIDAENVPISPSAIPLAQEGIFPSGAYRNMQGYEGSLVFGDDWDIDRQLIFADPQTNGGLLIAVEPNACEDIIGSLREQGCDVAARIGKFEAINGAAPRVYFNL
ncbi:selenide, water dikinase SelD [Gammaproteobacteria bacterium]|nr:selenide, water dikinase SelD [Gammaproteobacteria bacterium]